MVRPTRIRRIFFQPDVTYFKPAGIPMANLKETILSFDELEAIRLIDSEKMDQNKAGEKMKISQSTLSRLLRTGRKKLTDAIINGQAIKIQGGNFKMEQPRDGRFRAPVGGKRSLMGEFTADSRGIVKCPKCGYEKSQIISHPYINKKGIKCQTQITRE